MKMVKSLLLGSAAGLVAVAGAQAADLPVKAKPVQYVKICSLYGVGFYYIPGTDMCLKIGGWVRAEYGYGQNGNFAWGLGQCATPTTVRPTTVTSVLAVTSLLTHVIRLNTAPSVATSRLVCQHERAWRRRRCVELVQCEPRLHPVGGFHVWSCAIVLRLL